MSGVDGARAGTRRGQRLWQRVPQKRVRYASSHKEEAVFSVLSLCSANLGLIRTSSTSTVVRNMILH